MEPDNTLLLDLWESIRGYCPAKKRDELALRLLYILEDHGADSRLYEQLREEDFNLDNAIDEWNHNHNEDEDNEYFEEDEDI